MTGFESLLSCHRCILDISGHIFASIKGHVVEFNSALSSPTFVTFQAENNMQTEAHMQKEACMCKTATDVDSGHLPLPQTFLDLCSASRCISHQMGPPKKQGK